LKYAGIIALVVTLQACDVAKHRKTLSFFFDGVPADGASENSEAFEQAAPNLDAALVEGEEAFLSLHKPWQERRCESCHDRNAKGFLRTERSQLCYTCHDEHAFSGEWVHGPVSVSACLTCHMPHRSKQAHLLKLENQALCLQCHELPNTCSKNGANATKECLGCHGPHQSTNRFLLRTTAYNGNKSP